MGIDNLFMKTTNSKGPSTVAVVTKLFTVCVCVCVYVCVCVWVGVWGGELRHFGLPLYSECKVIC